MLHLPLVFKTIIIYGNIIVVISTKVCSERKRQFNNNTFCLISNLFCPDNKNDVSQITELSNIKFM